MRNRLLAVYYVLGRSVATLVDGERAPELPQVQLHGSRMAAGVYFYRIRMENLQTTKKLVVRR